MSENRCVACGDVIPEGAQYCRKCWLKANDIYEEDTMKKSFKKKWQKFWKKVRRLFK